MKTILSAFVAVAFLFAAAPAIAAAPPKVVVLKAKEGDVTFDHTKHQKLGCKSCHPGAPAKITFETKEKAHDLCVNCHKEKKQGPTECKDCHKKA